MPVKWGWNMGKISRDHTKKWSQMSKARQSGMHILWYCAIMHSTGCPPYTSECTLFPCIAFNWLIARAYKYTGMHRIFILYSWSRFSFVCVLWIGFGPVHSVSDCPCMSLAPIKQAERIWTTFRWTYDIHERKLNKIASIIGGPQVILGHLQWSRNLLNWLLCCAASYHSN